MPPPALDPTLAALLAQVPERDYDTRTVAQAREEFSALVGPPAADELVRDELLLAGVPVRRYAGASTTPVVYLHGGGWVVGSVDTHDRLVAALARRTGATVYSVDYRLAPEHPFPAALEDALAVVRALALTSTGQLALAGDSAGANVAAAAAQVARDEGIPVVGQLLLYPATDLRGGYLDTSRYPSRERNARGAGLTLSAMQWFARHYVQDADAADPRVSPVCGDLADLPPAVVSVAEHDPLRDEGIAYADALRAAGNEVVLLTGEGLVHGYPAYAGVVPAAGEQLAAALDVFADVLTRCRA